MERAFEVLRFAFSLESAEREVFADYFEFCGVQRTDESGRGELPRRLALKRANDVYGAAHASLFVLVLCAPLLILCAASGAQLQGGAVGIPATPFRHPHDHL